MSDTPFIGIYSSLYSPEYNSHLASFTLQWNRLLKKSSGEVSISLIWDHKKYQENQVKEFWNLKSSRP